jgi:hypothetical protein
MGNDQSLSAEDAAILDGMSIIYTNPNIHKHPMKLKKEGGHHSCDYCGHCIKKGHLKYMCSKCGIGSWDMCMDCFSRECQKTAGTLHGSEASRIDDVVTNPAKRRELIEELEKVLPEATAEEDQMAIEVVIRLLKSPSIDKEKLKVAIVKVCGQHVKSHAKDAFATQFCSDMGMEMIDFSGICSALRLCSAIAKGDFKGAVQGALGLVVLQCAMAVACTIC